MAEQIILDRDLQLVVNSRSGAERPLIDGVRIGPNARSRAGGVILTTQSHENPTPRAVKAMQDVFDLVKCRVVLRLRLLET